MEPRTASDSQSRSLAMTMLITGLIAGTLDISAASIQTLLNGRDILNMWKFIASGVFGQAALSGGLGYSLLGLLFHYCIVMIWTAIFFFAYPRIGFLSKNRIVTAFVYGFFVQLCMSQIVLPLANTPPIPFRWFGQLKAALILVGAIGLPLSYFAHRFYSSSESK